MSDVQRNDGTIPGNARAALTFAAARDRAGYTQEGLAHALRVQLSTVGRWERGVSQPQIWIRPKIATTLGVSEHELVEIFSEMKRARLGNAGSTAALLADEIKRLRLEAGLSQPQLAEKIGTNRQQISLTERVQANLPPDDLISTIDSTLNAKGSLIELHRKATEEQRIRRQRDIAGQVTENTAGSMEILSYAPATSTRVSSMDSAADTMSAESVTGNASGVFVGMSLAAWDPKVPAGQSYVDKVRATSRQLIELDNQWGGIDVAGLANRAFRIVQQRIHGGHYLSTVERELYAAGAELAEVAGWIAFDAEQQALAAELNHEALHLARLVGDKDIEHLTLLNASMQAGYLHRHRESVLIAQAVIDDGRISPRVHAISLIRQARAYSRTGNRGDSLKAFDQARCLFFDGVSDRDPAWAWWIDTHEIDGQHGAAYSELGDRRHGIPLLFDVVNAIEKETPRYRVVFAARLLSELIGVQAWRDAQYVAEDLAANTAGIGSARAITLLTKTANQLNQQFNAPSTLSDTIQHITQQH